MGYHRAGFDQVFGVDSKPQPRYPFEFHQADAIAVLDMLLAGSEVAGYRLADFDGIHASPPCQGYSVTRHIQKNVHPDLVEPTRERLIGTGLPYIIENVVGAPLLNPVQLCGSSFGLDIERHRLFESNVPIMALPCAHHWQLPRFEQRHISIERRRARPNLARVITVAGHNTVADEARRAMEMPWASQDECNQAIPPAYTEYLGEFLLREVQHRAAA